MTGFTFAHGTVADVTSPASMPLHLLAADQPDGTDADAADASVTDASVTGTSAAGASTASARAARAHTAGASAASSVTGDGALRPAIVKVARYYLRMAQTRTPAEM